MKILLLLLPLLVFAGCQDPASSNPETSARLFAESILQKNWKRSCQLLDKESAEQINPDCPEKLARVYGPVGLLYKKVQTKLVWREDSYTVVSTESVPERVYLRWEDGAWRVTLKPPRYLEQIR